MDVFDDHDLANSLTQGLGLPTPPISAVFPVHAKVSFDVEWTARWRWRKLKTAPNSSKALFSAPAPRSVGLPNRKASNFNRTICRTPKRTSFPCWGARRTGSCSAERNGLDKFCPRRLVGLVA